MAQGGSTPAHSAAMNGHVEALKYLGSLKEGALLKATAVRLGVCVRAGGHGRGRGRDGWLSADGESVGWWAVGGTWGGVRE